MAVCRRYGSWGVCFTYGTWFGIEALAALGETFENSPVLSSALNPPEGPAYRSVLLPHIADVRFRRTEPVSTMLQDAEVGSGTSASLT